MANDKDFKVKNGLDVGSSTNHTVTLNAYGTGTNTGLPAQALNVDENGNVIEVDAGVLPFVVHNDTGATLVKGTVVYVSGLNGNTPEVSLARANSSSTMPAYGLVEEDIANTADGTVVTFGSLKGLDVSDFGETGITFSLGDTVYISSSEAGKLTNVAPTGEANLIQNIGKIERASPTTNMTIKVGGAGRTNATPNLNDGNFFLGNSSNQAVPADFTGSIDSHLNQANPTDGYVLSWTSGDYAWVAGGGGGSSTFAGLTEANTADVDLHDVALQAKTTYVVTAPSSSEYRFDINGTDNNPTIYVRAGETIAFDLTALAGSHPFQIEDNAGSAYSTGLVHIATDGTRTTGASAQGKTSGTLYWKVPASINGTYEYQCTSHGGMNGDIIVTPDSAAGGLQTEEHPTVTNGSATVTLANARTLNEIEVYLNGVKLRGGTTLGGTTEWTVSGTTLTFNQNLTTGDEVTVVSLVTATAALAEEFPTVTAGSADVTMSQAFTLSQIDVYLNGVRLKATDEYTVSGSTLTLGENLVSGDIVAVVPRIEATDATLASLSDTNVTGVSDGELLRYDNSTSKYVPTSMVEDSSGNVGIGTTSPASTLDVDGEIRSVGVHLTQGNAGVVDARFAFDQDGTQVGWIGSPQWDSDGLYIYGPTASSGTEPVLKYSASQLELRTSNTNRLVIDSSGNVGIGTSSPAEELDVYGSIGLGGKEIARRSGNDVLLGDLNGILSGGGGAVTIRTNGGDKLKVDTSGNVLVGTTTNNTNCGIVVQANLGTRSGIEVQTNSTNQNAAMYFYNPNGVVGSIMTSGSSTAFNTSSDYRLKENVVDLTSAIERLKLIPVHRFNFIADPDTTVDGFIAHEVQPHVPEAVTGEKDAVDENGDIKPQGIDQSKLVPLLTAAIQEQQTQIEAQQATIEALEARLTVLEGA